MFTKSASGGQKISNHSPFLVRISSPPKGSGWRMVIELMSLCGWIPDLWDSVLETG